MTAALRASVSGVMRDGNLLGRVLDKFVAAQLRPETVISAERPRLHHLRTHDSRQEIDIIIELGARRLIAIEVKADAAPSEHDSRHLAWLRDSHDADFLAGVVFHTGPRLYALGERTIAAPISVLWG